MPDTIRIVVKRVVFHRRATRLGSGEFRFSARVDSVAVPGSADVHRAAGSGPVDLTPEASWSRVVDVRSPRTRVQVSFSLQDAHGPLVDTVTHDLPSPFFQRHVSCAGQHFDFEFDVQVEIDGAHATRPRGEVFVCRAGPGSALCTTVSGGASEVRLEVHPVRPTPARGMPPRPPFTRRARAVTNGRAAHVGPMSPMNIVPNPPVIPILSAAEVGPETAARIETTYYAPASLAFTDSDPRLVWSVVSVAGGGGATFVGPNRGLKVLVNGTAAGEVLLEVRLRGVVLCTYRALVRPIRRIPCRVNILNGPPGSRPRSTPEQVLQHLSIANHFLRQIALELVLDTDTTVTGGAVATSIPGIFRIDVAAGLTRNIPMVIPSPPTALNARPNVMNFAYVHSDATNNYGAATDHPRSTLAGTTITDTGTITASWSRPSGVAPDAAAAHRPMRFMGSLGTTAGRFAMYVTNANGDPASPSGQEMYAGTIAHEFGHILNLGHRNILPGDVNDDTLTHPRRENLMNGSGAPTSVAQDLDILQAKVALASPLVPP